MLDEKTRASLFKSHCMSTAVAAGRWQPCTSWQPAWPKLAEGLAAPADDPSLGRQASNSAARSGERSERRQWANRVVAQPPPKRVSSVPSPRVAAVQATIQSALDASKKQRNEGRQTLAAAAKQLQTMRLVRESATSHEEGVSTPALSGKVAGRTYIVRWRCVRVAIHSSWTMVCSEK